MPHSIHHEFKISRHDTGGWAYRISGRFVNGGEIRGVRFGSKREVERHVQALLDRLDGHEFIGGHRYSLERNLRGYVPDVDRGYA